MPTSSDTAFAGQQYRSLPTVNQPFGFNDQFYGDDLYDLYSSITPESLATPFADPYQCPFFQNYTPEFRAPPPSQSASTPEIRNESESLAVPQEHGSLSDSYCSEDSSRGERRK